MVGGDSKVGIRPPERRRGDDGQEEESPIPRVVG